MRVGAMDGSGARQTNAVATSCGRLIIAGRLRLAGTAAIGRVTLRVGPDRDGQGSAWVSLTVAEARQLAQSLLVQAKAIGG